MIPRAKDLRKLWFEWPESLYGRFNFQRDEHIDALVERLLDDAPPAVVVLGGEPGIGRSFLCDAAAQRARGQRHKVAVWHLDLDGFEPDIANPLTAYLRHLIDQEERQREAARDKVKGAMKSAAKTLSKLDLIGQASVVAASLLSLLWQFEDPLKRFADVLSQPPRGGPPPRDDPDTLHRFLTELTRDHKLLVHVTDSPQLTSNLRRWLIREAERAPERLLLVLSCPVDQATKRAAPEARTEPERIDVLPLDRTELRDLLDLRFDPNEFPDDLVSALMHRCHGRPAAIANRLADLMEVEVLISEGEMWRLPPEGLEDPRLVEAFSRGLFEEVDKPLVTLAEDEPELARVLRDLLSLAALCGRYVPMTALTEHLQLDEPTAEAAVDWVDNVLVGELTWLTDLGFHFAGFHGHNVYTFKHPLLPLVILNHDSQGERKLRAAALLRFLDQRVHVNRRSWARCFLSISEHLSDREREPYECSLAWWIGFEAADALQAEIRKEIESEEIDPELVWRVAADSEAWPAFRRLAVLEAYAQAKIGKGKAVISVVPFDRLADFYLLRAKLLDDVGRYAESLDNALNALELVDQNPLKRARALNASGMARRHLGDVKAAKPDLEAALVLDQENLGQNHPDTLTVMNNLAVTLWSLGELAQARRLHEQVLAIRLRVMSEEHPDILSSMSNLAEALRVMGDLASARQLHRQTLERRRRVLGEEHPDTLHSMHKLAITLRTLENLAEARQLEEQALEGRRRVLGEQHPHTWMSMDNLAVTLSALGDLAVARKLHVQTMEMRERVLGIEHPDTTVSTCNLLLTVRQLDESDAEAQLIDKLRWLLDRNEDSISSADQRNIRQWLLDLLNPS